MQNRDPMKRIQYYRGYAEDERGRTANKWDRETFEAVEKATKAISKALNGGNRKAAEAGLLFGLVNEHRYLQGESIVTILMALGHYGGLPEGTYVDDRNRFVHKVCAKLREALKDDLYWGDM